MRPYVQRIEDWHLLRCLFVCTESSKFLSTLTVSPFLSSRYPDQLFCSHELHLKTGSIYGLILLGDSTPTIWQFTTVAAQGMDVPPACIMCCFIKVGFLSSFSKLAFSFLSFFPQFFPYILLLLAILLYIPALFWRFTAAPHLSSDLNFIMEELDRFYNRSIKLAKNLASFDSKDGPEESQR